MKMNINHILLTPAISILLGTFSGCGENPTHSDKPTETAVDTKNRITQLRAELGTDNGSSAYCELHHMGKEGFEALIQAHAQSEISPDEFISWSFDLATRWPDGERLSGSYLDYLSIRAEDDEALSSKLADFYSRFPDEVLDDLKKHGRGAEEVARKAAMKRDLEK
jgi:hypothetical protein